MSYSLEEITNDLFFNIGLGRFGQDIVRYHKFGKSLESGTIAKDVWTRTHDLTYSTVPEAYYAVSNNVADVGVKIGVEGIIGTGEYIREIITLNGTTPVQLTGLWKRAFRIRIENGQTNLGEIFISTNAISSTPADIEIRSHATVGVATRGGASFMSHFTVPKGYVALIYNYAPNAPGNADIEFTAYARKDLGIFVPYDLVSITGGSFEKDFNFLPFPEGYDFKVMVQSSSTVNRAIPVTYDLLLVTSDWFKADNILPKGIHLG